MRQDQPNNGVKVRRLIQVPKFNDYHPDPSRLLAAPGTSCTPAALRWIIFTNKNDFNRCIVRRGKRVLIDENEYFRQLDEQNKVFLGRAEKP